MDDLVETVAQIYTLAVGVGLMGLGYKFSKLVWEHESKIELFFSIPLILLGFFFSGLGILGLCGVVG